MIHTHTHRQSTEDRQAATYRHTHWHKAARKSDVESVKYFDLRASRKTKEQERGNEREREWVEKISPH